MKIHVTCVCACVHLGLPSHPWGTVLLSNVGFYQSQRWVNSTKCRAGEPQALQKGRIIRCLQEILILETDEEHRVVLVIKPTEAGTIFQAANDSRGSNQSTHVQWAHDEANLLRSGESHCSPRIGLFFLARGMPSYQHRT